MGRLERELGVSGPIAQVLVRRGLRRAGGRARVPGGRRRASAGRVRGIGEAVEPILAHVRSGERITVHGDYDVDGICSTAVLVRVLRDLGANVDWYLPDRVDDGYGLAAETVRRLAAGTRLLLTVDCGITAVEQVAAAGARHGRDRHRPPRPAPRRAAAAPIVHAPVRVPVSRSCARPRVVFKLAQALYAQAGATRARARAAPRPGGARDDRRRRAAGRREPRPRPRRPAPARAHHQAGLRALMAVAARRPRGRRR